MSVIGKIRVPGESVHGGLISSTLFGRCESLPSDSIKLVKIIDNNFSSSNNLMDGMTLKVFFKYANTCLTPSLSIVTNDEHNTPLIGGIPIMSYRTYLSGGVLAGATSKPEQIVAPSSVVIGGDYYANTWGAGGIVNFTYMRLNTSAESPQAEGDYWIIDNQCLSSNYAYGYFSTKNGVPTNFIDMMYGIWDVETDPDNPSLIVRGYNNPEIKTGRYIYRLGNGAGQTPSPTGTNVREGVLEVIHCPTIAGEAGHGNNYVIQTWTFYDEPNNFYRRCWLEPSPNDWTVGSGWSEWYYYTGTQCI